jgi:hypothetical protein
VARSRNPDQGAVGVGDADRLTLSAVDSIGSKRAADEAARWPSRAAIGAGAVAVLERRDDEVALRDIAYRCPDPLDHADEFVADWAEVMRGLPAVVPEVRATDAPQHDSDDRVPRRRDHGVRPVGYLDAPWPEKDCGTHTSNTLIGQPPADADNEPGNDHP